MQAFEAESGLVSLHFRQRFLTVVETSLKYFKEKMKAHISESARLPKDFEDTIMEDMRAIRTAYKQEQEMDCSKQAIKSRKAPKTKLESEQ